MCYLYRMALIKKNLRKIDEHHAYFKIVKIIKNQGPSHLLNFDLKILKEKCRIISKTNV